MHICSKFNGGKQVIDPKEGPGKEGVAFGLMKDQYGDWHAGLRSPILKPANVLNLFLLLRAKRLQLIINGKQRIML